MISFDMGGTTAKAAIVEDGEPARTTEYEVGAGINVVPFMIQRTSPGIGPFVVEAFAFAAVPAVLAAMPTRS